MALCNTAACSYGKWLKDHFRHCHAEPLKFTESIIWNTTSYIKLHGHTPVKLFHDQHQQM